MKAKNSGTSRSTERRGLKSLIIYAAVLFIAVCLLVVLSFLVRQRNDGVLGNQRVYNISTREYEEIPSPRSWRQ
jgi:hypothetical protein